MRGCVGLFVQFAALAVGGVLLVVAAHRPLERRTIGVWIAVAAAAVLVVEGGNRIRGGWKQLDATRDANAAVTADGRRLFCLTDTGADAGFFAWLTDRVPADASYYLAMRPEIAARTADLCVTMALLPRRRVDRVEDARYVVLWADAPPDVVGSAQARGAVELSYGPGLELLRVP
jgi:hypothetical protein